MAAGSELLMAGQAIDVQICKQRIFIAVCSVCNILHGESENVPAVLGYNLSPCCSDHRALQRTIFGASTMQV